MMKIYKTLDENGFFREQTKLEKGCWINLINPTVQEINKFMKSFEMTQTMMKRMKSQKGGMNKMLKGMDINQLKGMMK